MLQFDSGAQRNGRPYHDVNAVRQSRDKWMLDSPGLDQRVPFKGTWERHHPHIIRHTGHCHPGKSYTASLDAIKPLKEVRVLAVVHIQSVR